jgi:hypothetical protein
MLLCPVSVSNRAYDGSVTGSALPWPGPALGHVIHV